MSDQPKPTKLEEIETLWSRDTLGEAADAQAEIMAVLNNATQDEWHWVEVGKFDSSADANLFVAQIFNAHGHIAWLVARVEELEKRLDDRFRDEAADMRGIGPSAR